MLPCQSELDELTEWRKAGRKEWMKEKAGVAISFSIWLSLLETKAETGGEGRHLVKWLPSYHTWEMIIIFPSVSVIKVFRFLGGFLLYFWAKIFINAEFTMLIWFNSWAHYGRIGGWLLLVVVAAVRMGFCCWYGKLDFKVDRNMQVYSIILGGFWTIGK